MRASNSGADAAISPYDVTALSVRRRRIARQASDAALRPPRPHGAVSKASPRQNPAKDRTCVVHVGGRRAAARKASDDYVPQYGGVVYSTSSVSTRAGAGETAGAGKVGATAVARWLPERTRQPCAR